MGCPSLGHGPSTCPEELAPKFLATLNTGLLFPIPEPAVDFFVVESWAFFPASPLSAWIHVKPAVVCQIKQAGITLVHWLGAAMHARNSNGASDGIRTRGPQNHNLML